MKKVAFSVLVATFLIEASSAQAGTLTFIDSIPMQDIEWGDEEPLTLEVPKYNRRETLLSIFVEVSSEVMGTYTLTSNRRSGNIRYGNRNDAVGALVEVSGASNSIFFDPTPIQNIGAGTLRPRQSITLAIAGSDTKNALIDNSSFNFFTGRGKVLFNASALNNVDVSILGAGFSQSFDLQADARLQVIYTYQDAPPRSIPEPGTFVGLLAFAGLGLAANRRRAS